MTFKDFIDIKFNIFLLKSENLIKNEFDFIHSYSNKFIGWLYDFTPKIITSIIVLIAGYWLIGVLSRVIARALKRKEIEVSLLTFLKSMVSIGLKIILFITVAGMLGIQNTSFVAIIGAAGLALGLALQGSLSNFAGGVLILMFKPYRVEDIIEAQGQTGKVTEIQIFNTVLLTPDNKTIILPNGNLANGTVVNFSKEGNIGINIDIEIGYENNISDVRKTILEVMNSNSKLLKTPCHLVIVLRFGDGSVFLGLRAFTKIGDLPFVKSEILEEVKEALMKNGFVQPPIKRITL
ncbi:MAG: mechanosensitive ion channel family protein [Cytophagales bacterium]|nr:MAG: mechanosensitive ion channel family protein [Cytophagales bacterium]